MRYRWLQVKPNSRCSLTDLLRPGDGILDVSPLLRAHHQMNKFEVL